MLYSPFRACWDWVIPIPQGRAPGLGYIALTGRASSAFVPSDLIYLTYGRVDFDFVELNLRHLSPLEKTLKMGMEVRKGDKNLRFVLIVCRKVVFLQVKRKEMIRI